MVYRRDEAPSLLKVANEVPDSNLVGKWKNSNFLYYDWFKTKSKCLNV